MKIKKKEVSRLHEIIYGPSFYDGNDEVCEIKLILNKICERSQNKSETKTVQEEPVDLEKFFRRMASFDHRMGLFNNIIKQGEAMVAASTDETTIFKGGLRDAVEALSEPKIGDVGFFWTTGGDTRYGKIKEISSSEFKGETYTVYRIDQSDGCEFYVHFSKTPPELK